MVIHSQTTGSRPATQSHCVRMQRTQTHVITDDDGICECVGAILKYAIRKHVQSARTFARTNFGQTICHDK